MQLFENISLAINGLRANKMRALLTMLGIIIGISSVITIVTIGDSMSNSVTAMFNELGANSVQIMVTDKPDDYGNVNYNREYEESDLITYDMIQQYKDAFGSKIEAVAVSTYIGGSQAINGHNRAQGSVVGSNAGAIKIQNVPILAGHFLNDREVSGAKNVVVLSDKFVSKLFPNTSFQKVLGQEVKLRMPQGTYTFSVVGIYHFEVSGMMSNMVGDTTTTVFIPEPVAHQIVGGKKGFSYMQVRASDEVTDSRAFADQTRQYFNRRFYRSNKYVEIETQSMESMLGQMTGIMDKIKMAISVIAAISLLVGGIGVMNIMLVSVTERTREIGTRKALGAKNSAIRVQFIVESMIICLFGGVIGVVLGTSLGRLGSSLIGAPGWPSPLVVMIAVGFSMAIGVFFGYYPASKAAKLNPIEALRYE